ncbi:MAG: hypothetical protein R3E48_07625 [Burkholderiaceae bacterium]
MVTEFLPGRWVRAVFCLVLALVASVPGSANAKPPPKPGVSIVGAPAKFAGEPKDCAASFPASGQLDRAFLHVWNGTCWSCPKGYHRTIDPNVAGGRACKLDGATRHARAVRHGRGTGLLKTDCPRGSGQFWHVGDGHCYACPRGFHRTVAPISSANACKRTDPDRFARGTQRGKAGCPAGSFRNGLQARCYQCPAGYKRSLAIGSDLTKMRDACVRVTIRWPKIDLPIPRDIVQRATREVRKFSSLIALVQRKLPAHQKAYAAHGKLESIRDAEIDKAAAAQGLQTVSVGAGIDLSSPYAVSGGGSVEVSHSTRRWSGFRKTATVGLQGSVPGAAATGTLQFSFLTEDIKSFDGWSLVVSVDGGAAAGAAGSVSASFGIELTPKPRFVFQGITVAGGVGVQAKAGVGAGVGPAFQVPI